MLVKSAVSNHVLSNYNKVKIKMKVIIKKEIHIFMTIPLWYVG